MTTTTITVNEQDLTPLAEEFPKPMKRTSDDAVFWFISDVSGVKLGGDPIESVASTAGFEDYFGTVTIKNDPEFAE